MLHKLICTSFNMHWKLAWIMIMISKCIASTKSEADSAFQTILKNLTISELSQRFSVVCGLDSRAKQYWFKITIARFKSLTNYHTLSQYPLKQLEFSWCWQHKLCHLHVTLAMLWKTQQNYKETKANKRNKYQA